MGSPVDRRSRQRSPLTLPGPDDPGAGELPQPCLPPRAAGADAAGAGDVLDLARADVRRRGAARPRLLPRAGDGHVPRDGRGRDHLRGGVPLPAPPARRHAVRRPERDGPRPARGGPATAGLRITLLDTCYLTAGIGRPVEGVQRRFSDGDVDGWGRAGRRPRGRDGARIGGAYHSVRAVPRDQMKRHTASPLHIHLSEQVAENEQCLAAYGLTPTAGLRRGRPPHRPQHAGPRDPPHRRRRRADRRGAGRTSTSAPPPSATSATASGRAARSTTPAPG